jgi:hypothetical protein
MNSAGSQHGLDHARLAPEQSSPRSGRPGAAAGDDAVGHRVGRGPPAGLGGPDGDGRERPADDVGLTPYRGARDQPAYRGRHCQDVGGGADRRRHLPLRHDVQLRRRAERVAGRGDRECQARLRILRATRADLLPAAARHQPAATDLRLVPHSTWERKGCIPHRRRPDRQRRRQPRHAAASNAAHWRPNLCRRRGAHHAADAVRRRPCPARLGRNSPRRERSRRTGDGDAAGAVPAPRHPGRRGIHLRGPRRPPHVAGRVPVHVSVRLVGCAVAARCAADVPGPGECRAHADHRPGCIRTLAGRPHEEQRLGRDRKACEEDRAVPGFGGASAPTDGEHPELHDPRRPRGHRRLEHDARLLQGSLRQPARPARRAERARRLRAVPALGERARAIRRTGRSATAGPGPARAARRNERHALCAAVAADAVAARRP